MKYISKVLFIFMMTLMSLTVSQESQAQVMGSLDASTVRVDDLTDDQIRMINSRIREQGLSIEEAMTLAGTQGLPASEVSKLRVRLSTVSEPALEDSISTMEQSMSVSLDVADLVEEVPDESEISIPVFSMDDENLTDDITIMAAEDRSNIYGHSMFANQSIDFFTTTDGARAPDWYVLGTGDQIRITIFGVSQADLLLEVSDDGYIQPTGMPRIFLKGLTIKQSEKLLRDRLSNFYTFEAEEFSLTIKVARTITVNIFGETVSQGSFTVSALNTALNVLSVAGGPTELGSVRSIQHIQGDDRQEIDLYEFMQDPSVQTEYDLRHHDVLFLPLAEKIVNLRGAVKRPMRYELKGKEGFLDLLKFAGGIRPDTAPNYVQIQRIEDGEPRLFEYNLSEVLERGENLSLQDGDIVMIRQIGRDLEKVVEISGAVFYPGAYDLSDNRQLKSLLEKAELRPEAVLEKAIVLRRKQDGSIQNLSLSLSAIVGDAEGEFLLEPRDQIRIFNQSQYVDIQNVTITGSVRNSVSIPLEFDDRLSLADALFMAEGLQTTAAPRAFVFRRELFNPEIVRHIPVNMTKDAEFELLAGDRLVVYDQRDYTNLGELTLSGAVGSSVTTVFDQTLSIRDLLVMAGGITIDAALDRVDVFRLDISFRSGTSYEIITLEIDDSLNVVKAPENFQLQPYDRIIVRRIPEFYTQANVQLDGEVKYTGTYPLESRKVKLSDIMKIAGGLTERADGRHALIFRSFNGVGPISVDLDKALSGNAGSEKHDPVLFDGDVISIPQLQNTVTIRLNATGVGDLQAMGVVNEQTEIGGQNDVNVIYKGNRSARWYIENFAGGFAKEADKWSVTVTRPNGEVQSTQRRMLFFRDYPTVVPGSTITLRYKPEEPENAEEIVNWEEVQARSIQLTTTVLTFLVLLDRLTTTN